MRYPRRFRYRPLARAVVRAAPSSATRPGGEEVFDRREPRCRVGLHARVDGGELSRGAALAEEHECSASEVEHRGALVDPRARARIPRAP